MYVLIKLHDVYECIHAFVEGIHHHEYTYADTVMCVYVRRIRGRKVILINTLVTDVVHLD